MVMLRLHGYPVSNYFNAVRASLIEKGAPFEVVMERASQDDAFLRRSAMGKIPYLETNQGCIAETVSILEYIEDTAPGLPLYPSDTFARAKVRQVMNIIQVYIDTPMRTLFPGVFMGGSNAPETVGATRFVLDRAIAALCRILTPDPFLMGPVPTHADFLAFYTFDLGERVFSHVYGESLLERIPGVPQWFAMMQIRPSTQIVQSDFSPAFAAYLRDRNAAWREPELALS